MTRDSASMLSTAASSHTLTTTDPPLSCTHNSVFRKRPPPASQYLILLKYNVYDNTARPAAAPRLHDHVYNQSWASGMRHHDPSCSIPVHHYEAHHMVPPAFATSSLLNPCHATGLTKRILEDNVGQLRHMIRLQLGRRSQLVAHCDCLEFVRLSLRPGRVYCVAIHISDALSPPHCGRSTTLPDNNEVLHVQRSHASSIATLTCQRHICQALVYTPIVLMIRHDT